MLSESVVNPIGGKTVTTDNTDENPDFNLCYLWLLMWFGVGFVGVVECLVFFERWQLDRDPIG